MSNPWPSLVIRPEHSPAGHDVWFGWKAHISAISPVALGQTLGLARPERHAQTVHGARLTETRPPVGRPAFLAAGTLSVQDAMRLYPRRAIRKRCDRSRRHRNDDPNLASGRR